MRFTKMHGCGNDFILVDRADGPLSIGPEVTRALCDRRTGIGADGILVVGLPASPTPRRWPLEIHNADGTQAEACGNGSRCVARYLLDRHGGDDLELETAGGIVPARRDPAGIAIELARPEVGEAVPLHLDGVALDARSVRVGNPNVVVFVEDPDRADLAALAAAATAIAGPANVVAVHRSGPAELTVRVHERGVGETLACGTGSCAAVAAALASDGVTGDTVRVRLRGGTLEVRPRGERYVLAGPAEYVYQGER
ncbi:MAG TPA: diaminopimelate epimerase [Candidatus Saccharimonadales bacterium]|nr:diaminopimelate epimerase [Candidatus Saccharimonadales bacterium]